MLNKSPEAALSIHQKSMTFITSDDEHALKELNTPNSSGETPEYTVRSFKGKQDNLLIKVYSKEPYPLSSLLPVLGSFNIDIESINSYEISEGDNNIFVHRFNTQFAITPRTDRDTFFNGVSGALVQLFAKQGHPDSLNSLLLYSPLELDDVAILRSLSRYLIQLNFGFSEGYIHEALVHNPDAADLIAKVFKLRHTTPEKAQGQLDKLEMVLEAVNNSDHDRIIRALMELIQASLRCNLNQDSFQDYLAIKFKTADISFAPLPHPLYEIFVYSDRFEGVHLRGGKVARGGLRWSDRYEDFRTEVLGLVKAQMVKNAVIVPQGSKGGFICKSLPNIYDRQAQFEEGQACYKLFITALLSLTDNLVEGEVVAADCVRHDEDDTYLVVAADKGTATFSDLANEIAIEKGFWLGDAFASGGSVGYDHKKMGITARGAWESVKNHFRELDLDPQQDEITVVGVGDMSGDVFGNGMLLSDKIKLVAAFNHLHIFIDPNPNSADSFIERQRMFALPRSTWEDYDKSKLSEGGAVFSRHSKRVTISEEARKALGLSKTTMTPDELIKGIIKAPVDLFWNGGIGTYAKASNESHIDVADKQNDAVRVNAKELRCKVVGEGGNLGLTQQARIEFARNGGFVNTDSIDNSGGVDCSDHEVNLKILLNQVLQGEDRNQLLENLTDEVAELVLANNYQQSLSLGISNYLAPHRVGDHQFMLDRLESVDAINRDLDQLPTSEDLMEYANDGEGMNRPQLSILYAQIKLNLREELKKETLSQDQYLKDKVISYFPEAVRETYKDAIEHHPLKENIIATEMVNHLSHHMCITFFDYISQETNVGVLDIFKAYFAAFEIFEIKRLWDSVGAAGQQISFDNKAKIYERIQDFAEKATIWMLKANAGHMSILQTIAKYKDQFETYKQSFSQWLDEHEQAEVDQFYSSIQDAREHLEFADELAMLPYYTYHLEIIELASQFQEDVEGVAKIYFGLNQHVNLAWIKGHLTNLAFANIWQRRARAMLRDEVDAYMRHLTKSIINQDDKSVALAEREARWLELKAPKIDLALNLFKDIDKSGHFHLSTMIVASKQIEAIL